MLINLSQTGHKVYKGLILPAARAKAAGEIPEVETQVHRPQNLNLQSDFQGTICASMKSPGTNWFPPVGNQE